MNRVTLTQLPCRIYRANDVANNAGGFREVSKSFIRMRYPGRHKRDHFVVALGQLTYICIYVYY